MMPFLKVNLLIIILIFAINSFAQFSGGSGSADDPWIISTPEDLDNIRNFLGSEHNDKHYLQVNDIDLGVPPWNEGEGWEPIGYQAGGEDFSGNFQGSYNGNGYVVNGLYINRPETDRIALFNRIFDAEIKNLGVTNVDITGRWHTAALTVANFYSTIINCFSTGNVTGQRFVGGLVASNSAGFLGMWGYSHIESSYSSCNVTGLQTVGGLSASSTPLTTISNSYAIGNVTGTSEVGGLVGQFFGATITNSYATGFVTGADPTGGLIGLNHIASGFSGVVINSYWDIDTSGQNESVLGEGRSTEEMTYPYSENTFLDWDFDEIWSGDSDYVINNGYPYLLWQEPILPPELAHAHSPVPYDGATEIPVKTSIGWTYTIEEGYEEPDGFIVNMWTEDITEDPFQIDIQGGAGDYLFEQHPFDFDHKMTYLWQVIPYVLINDDYIYAEDCPIWTFVTEKESSTDLEAIQNMSNLIGNYPNPFNPVTTIKYSLAEDVSTVTIKVYNVSGQLIRTLIHGKPHEKGQYYTVWDGKNESGQDVTSGFYLYRMTTPSFDQVNKMILLK